MLRGLFTGPNLKQKGKDLKTLCWEMIRKAVGAVSDKDQEIAWKS